MQTSRVSTGELIAGASGLALFLFLFLDWFGPLNGWQLFDFMDIVLAVIGLGTAATVAARAAGTQVNLPGGPTTVMGLEGFAAFWIVVTFLIEGDERKIGLWLALLASIGIIYGALTAMKGGARAAAAPPPAAPPPTGAPPAV